MRNERINITNENSMEYAVLYTYLLDDSGEMPIHSRPMVIVCPGGAYSYTSDREAEIIAVQFVAMGYHAAVLRYSVAPAVFPTALLEVGKSIAVIRENAEEWHVHPDQIFVCGFSAGGHLAASFCTFWSEAWVSEKLGTCTEKLRPNGMILGYPVITAGEYTHTGSMENVLGVDFPEKRDTMSLEKYVNGNMPRAFIWHTFEDAAVPIQNSLLLVNEMVRMKIPVEYHMFEKGGHGMALGNRLTQANSGFGAHSTCSAWIDLVHAWMEDWLKNGEGKYEFKV